MGNVRGKRSAPLWADLAVGLVSGLIIPTPIIAFLDLGLLVLGLWYVFTGMSQLGAPAGQSPWQALAVTLATNLLNMLRHLWAIRWGLLASGGLGALAALARRGTPRIPGAWGRVLGFLAILAVLSLAFNGLFLLRRETQVRLLAVGRVVHLLQQIGGESGGKSYEVDLAIGTVAALAVSLLFWEAWQALYRRLGAWAGLPQPHKGFAPYRRATAQAWRAEQMAEGPQMRTLAWTMGALTLCLVAWLPLHSAFALYAPSSVPRSIYLHPGAPERVERTTLGAYPREIVFASAVGHGLFDAELLTGPEATKPLREVRDFLLKETPRGTYRYAHMSIEGLKPGVYILRTRLRPAGKLPPGASAVMEDGEGVISYTLYQGGGAAYRLVALGIAALLTVALLCAMVLLVEGMAYLRSR